MEIVKTATETGGVGVKSGANVWGISGGAVSMQ